ncbi:M56 family metallopeptidase [Phenylobacterium sp.]|uniref:M56 family metallopeptidase n=1 Tax=Phenylobacterium sp. TaxID=1871053 RepID=UPI0025ECFAFF|nr:M56 family metallopeptidase [Phenylobacterium sp.]
MNDLQPILGPDPALGLLAGFLGANVAVAATVLAVAVARLPARRALGPAAAYRLWLAPLIIALASLLVLFTPGDSETGSAAAALAAHMPHLGPIPAIWGAGMVALVALFTLAQARFLAEVRAGRGGPAVVGLIAPRIVLPADDGRYTPEERELIRAHEREHVARKDPRAAAVVALFQCLCWFNPFAHLAAYLLRLDQELACDAAVVMHRPGTRVLYARTLLKAQLATTPLPFGCYWPARGQHPLEVRIASLKRRTDRGRAGPQGDAVVLALMDAIRP